MVSNESRVLNTWSIVCYKYGKYGDAMYYTDHGFVHDLQDAKRFADGDDLLKAQVVLDELKTLFTDAEVWREKQKWSGRAMYIARCNEVTTVKLVNDD